MLRHYMGIKFSMFASLLMGSSVYALDKNLRLAVPYFKYYAVLNAARALLMTSPRFPWLGKNTMVMTHEKILNCATDELRALDGVRSTAWRAQLAALRSYRELYSYRFPLSGPHLGGDAAMDVESTLTLARLLTELASLNSECFNGCLTRHIKQDWPVAPLTDHDWARMYHMAGEDRRDPDDSSRFNKLARSWGTVSTLQVMTSDGMMDDIFGAWVPPDGVRDDAFDPDDHNGLLLQF